MQARSACMLLYPSLFSKSRKKICCPLLVISWLVKILLLEDFNKPRSAYCSTLLAYILPFVLLTRRRIRHKVSGISKDACAKHKIVSLWKTIKRFAVKIKEFKTMLVRSTRLSPEEWPCKGFALDCFPKENHGHVRRKDTANTSHGG